MYLFYYLFSLVSKHLSGNKIRNAIVREDFPHALMAQREAEEEAHRLASMALVKYYFGIYFKLIIFDIVFNLFLVTFHLF